MLPDYSTAEPYLLPLPVDNRPSADFLVYTNGCPVWPVQGEWGMRALEILAHLFAGVIKTVRGEIGQARPRSTEVVALGRMASDAGRLYTHLTGRRLRHSSGAADLCDFRPPPVVVTTPDQLTSGVMGSLYDNGKDAPGRTTQNFISTLA
jgi:hypothetical protein